MTATQLAALVVATVVAGVMACGAAVIVWRGRNQHDHLPTGFAAFGLGVAALIVFCGGASLSAPSDPSVPDPPLCSTGTYATHTSDGGPQCAPLPGWRP